MSQRWTRLRPKHLLLEEEMLGNVVGDRKIEARGWVFGDWASIGKETVADFSKHEILKCDNNNFVMFHEIKTVDGKICFLCIVSLECPLEHPIPPSPNFHPEHRQTILSYMPDL